MFGVFLMDVLYNQILFLDFLYIERQIVLYKFAHNNLLRSLNTEKCIANFTHDIE